MYITAPLFAYNMGVDHTNGTIPFELVLCAPTPYVGLATPNRQRHVAGGEHKEEFDPSFGVAITK